MLAVRAVSQAWQQQFKKAALLLASLGLAASVNAAGSAQVSVSNYPLYLLSQAVTEGATPAKQILKSGEVGHHGAISPGDIKTIQDSKFVVWFGAPLEANLAQTLTKAPNSISLFSFRAFHRAPRRDVKGAPLKGTLDPHLWLDPQNAKAISRALAVIHSHADPKNKALYQRNAQKFAQNLDNAVKEIQQQNAPSSYWAYHDAYQYLEPTLKLNFAGSLSSDSHLEPTAAQIKWLNDRRPKKQMCLVSEGTPKKGLVAKLKPVTTTIQQEDMSGARDFISGWRQMAKQISRCAA